MCLNKCLLKNQLYQSGVSLPAMIIFVVAIAIISAALIKLTSVANVAIGYEMVNTRTFFAAESGAQNQLVRLFPLDGSAATCASLNLTYATTNLLGCTVSVTCTGPTTIETEVFYTINSIGQCGSGDAISIREIQLQVKAPL